MIAKIKKLPFSMKFLFAMITAYLIFGFFNLPFTLSVFEKFLQTFFKLLPVLCLAFAVIFVINLFLKPEAIKKHLGHDSGLKGWLYAILASFIITGPPYVILPLLGELKKHGMEYSLIAAFLNNRNTQLAYLPVMVYYFGLPFAIIISIYTISFALISGIFMDRLMFSITGNGRS